MPVVRKTGGLNDTVFDVDDDVERALNAGMEPNGFSFVGADAAGLDYALNRSSVLPPCHSQQFCLMLCLLVLESFSLPALILVLPVCWS